MRRTNLRTVLVALALLTALGCRFEKADKPKRWTLVGHLANLDEITTSWNDSQRMKVVTKEGDIFFIQGIVSGHVGAEVFESDDGYLEVQGNSYSVPIYGGGGKGAAQ